jgi:2-oxoglutarate dehydrogenase E2 component (dihydrolipoamide succinyltransferase)
MARVEVVMPQMGESIAEGTIVKWHKKVGDEIKRDETLLEISTDKVDSEIPSPAAGVLSEIVVKEQETVAVQTVIAYLETDGDVVAKETSKETVLTAEKPKVNAESEPASPEVTVPKSVESVVQVIQPLERPVAGRFYSPLVLNIARTEGVSMSELERVPGSGTGGRVSKKDMLAYVEARKLGAPVSPVPTPGASLERAVGVIAKPVEVPELRKKYPAPQHDILQMGTVLQKMAEHMVKSVHTSPHVEAIHEVDLTRIVKHRNEHAVEFEKKEGFKLTFTPYIVDAVVKAIKKYPLVNSSVEGDKIIKKNFVNLGIAVASDNGLIVPVVKHAERKSFLGLARAVNDLASRTRNKKLTPEDVQGGTFTISNFGVFGTMVGTPIINQPQVAILGTGAIKKRVVVIDDAIAIRSTAYFTLSFDHRIVDGALGGVFLEEIVQKLQNFDTSMKF